MIPVHLAGARGLLAGEFLRLLEAHPGLKLAAVYARGGEGSLREHHPHLAIDAEMHPMSDLPIGLQQDLSRGPAVLLLALPHGASREFWQELQAHFSGPPEGLTVVDLSQDFRLDGGDVDGWPDWSYGLPELHPVPAGAQRIAAPGCFATALQLAIVPAARADVLAPGEAVLANAITGSSGSGAAPQVGTHHPHRDGDLWAYSWQGHRHEAEVLAPRNFPEGAPPLHFLAHSGPFRRGIHVSAVLPLGKAAANMDADALRQVYTQCYADADFVQVLPAGSTPHLRHVVGSNRVDLAVDLRHGAVQVFVALDNTLKGGAGQALQCLNLSLGFAEETALPSAGLAY